MNTENGDPRSLPPLRTRAFMAGADRRFKICYLYPHAKQDFEEASPFGWFTPGLLEAAGPIQRSLVLPADIREPHTSLAHVLTFRLTGAIWPQVLPVEIDSLAASLKIIPAPFIVCVTTDADVAAQADAIFPQHGLPVLHASTVSGAGRKPLQGLTVEAVCKFVREVLNVLAGREGFETFVRECRQIQTAVSQRKPRKHHLKLAGHNVVIPNELALAAFGYKFASVQYLSKPIAAVHDRSVDAYVRRICESADAVAKERSRLLGNGLSMLIDHRLVIAVASAYWLFYKGWRDFASKVAPEERRVLRQALSHVVQATTYYREVTMDTDGGPAFSRVERAVLGVLAEEMRAFTAGLSMQSCATLCPVLRLEPKLHQIRGDLKALADCVRARTGTHYAWKVARMMRALGSKMRSLVHPEFLKRIDAAEADRIEGLKLVTDLPLELLQTNGIPLGLRFDVSRTSPLPGNMFWQSSGLPPLPIPATAFYDVLIVRSFSAGDRIRMSLETALSTMSKDDVFKRVKYRFVDVTTAQEFVDAVNGCTGAILIFDGHGRYDADLGMGSLVVGGVSLDTWALKKSCHFPPVVMFSACDTQPIDGSHSSVASAAFALGARAVLGTMFPVHAHFSSIMMARMLLRLDQFLPIALTLFPALTWRHVVAGMLRMSHTTEAARALNTKAHLGLTQAALSRVQLAANNAINARSSTWYEEWTEKFGVEAGRTGAEICALLDRHVGLTDAMMYVQLGNPERLMIQSVS